MEVENAVARHYGREGLEQAILDALTKSGKDVDKLTASDLSAVDEFHLGWLAATVGLAKDLGLARGMDVLDVGSGIGGPARYFAEALDCRVTGIDLTPEYVSAANSLTHRCGLSDKATFKLGSAAELPVASNTFDAATLIHVGMNITDKARAFAEVRRVLKPQGSFGVYEVMRLREGDLAYPMPWATTPATSFVETPATYRQLLGEAGFTIDSVVDRREFVLKLWREMQEKAAKGPAPAISLAILMGPDAKERFTNLMSSLERSVIAPIEMIARAA